VIAFRAERIGKDTVLDEGRTGEEERKVIEEEGIDPDDFNVSAMPELASAGHRREILLRVKPQISVEVGAARLRYFLPAGCYATTVLREFMKESPEHMD
jgi:tRNA pseudouridine13 synthase